MTPDDLAALLKWLYANDEGGGWLPAAAHDLRLNERNLRGMLAGKLAIADELATAVALFVVVALMLNGWRERKAELYQLDLSPPAMSAIDHWRSVLNT